MAASGAPAPAPASAPAPTPAPAPAPPRQSRRGPAPIASFDHDVSDESSPETKQSFRLPEIREDGASGSSGGAALAPPEQRARSHSTPAAGGLGAPATPRIDISRASSSSHHDSRDSSPELALFAGGSGDDGRSRLELAFREDGALDLRSSTEELAFLEPAPGEPVAAPPPPRPVSTAPAPPTHPPNVERRHSRKDSQGSEAALLAVSGRTSRLSSVGSQCSAVSALSRVSRLSVVSGASRSPSPHRMLLETSFCGPKPIEADPEISAGALVEQILGIAKMSGADSTLTSPMPSPPAATRNVSAPAPTPVPPPPVAALDARDHREVRTEVTVESARSAPATPASAGPVPAAPTPSTPVDKVPKETKNQVQTEERRPRPRIRREPSEPEVYKSRNRSKDIIRIKLKPDDEEEEEEEAPSETAQAARKPATLELGRAARPAEGAPAPPSPAPSRRRSPSPSGAPVSRKSSFCSLFKSRETIASPDSPSEALKRKRSLTEGRSRSKSRDRSATPTSSSSKIRGSVMSLFRTPRRAAASPSAGSRDPSPGAGGGSGPTPLVDRRRGDRLKYYEDSKDGIIHIPLRTPPEERAGAEAAPREPRPASAPQPRALPEARSQTDPARPCPIAACIRPTAEPLRPAILPDGSIIIPLHSPTERAPDQYIHESSRADETNLGHKITAEPVAPPMQPDTTSSPAPHEWVAVSELTTSSPPEDSVLPSMPSGLVTLEESRGKKKERLVFTTHVGSREQVFSTQFSITKTPSVTSEMSSSFPSFAESEEPRVLRDSHIAGGEPTPPHAAASLDMGSGAGTPLDAPRDSSESEPSSEAAPTRTGNDVERRGLVVQESFEEDLPYVPTTLPQERSVALPMVPVRERGGVRVAAVQRPRASAPPPRVAPAPPPAPAQSSATDKLRIKLPRRPRTASATSVHRQQRPRTHSGGDSNGGESRSKQEWIDFEEVPERRKQPKRIQTLPAAAGLAGGAAPTEGGVVFSYVEPEHCRCECHARPDDQLPLLDEMHNSRISSSSAECGEEEQPAPPPLAGAGSAVLFHTQSHGHIEAPAPPRQ